MSNEISPASSHTHCSGAHRVLFPTALSVAVTSAKSAIAINASPAGLRLLDCIDRSACPAIVARDETKNAAYIRAHFTFGWRNYCSLYACRFVPTTYITARVMINMRCEYAKMEM
jgi:hypothetical protein